MKINRVTAALAATVAAFALVGTACSDDSDSSSPETTHEAQTSDTAASGSSSASVDGTAIDADFETTCAKQGDTIALALADLDNAKYGNLAVSATLTGDDTVTAVGIAGSIGGDNGLPYALGYGQGLPGGSAAVSKDGNTFTVTGEGVGTPSLTDPTAVNTAKFEITFACNEIVG